MPEVHVTPRLQSKRPGEDATMFCHVAGEPFPKVSILMLTYICWPGFKYIFFIVFSAVVIGYVFESLSSTPQLWNKSMKNLHFFLLILGGMAEERRTSEDGYS